MAWKTSSKLPSRPMGTWPGAPPTSPIEFDKLVTALEVAGDDSDAVETVIFRVNHKTVAWSGIVKRHRLVKNGPEKSEFVSAG